MTHPRIPHPAPFARDAITGRVGGPEALLTLLGECYLARYSNQFVWWS